MAPDFGYFVQRFGLAARSHQFTGTLTHALPMAFLVWVVVRHAREFLAAPLPQHLRESVVGFLGRPACPFPWLVLSLLLGIWSHTFLDSFTHASGWMAARLPALREPWPLYHVLQHLGSVAGILVLLMLWRRKAMGLEPRSAISMYSTLLLLLLISAFMALPFAMTFAARFDGMLMFRAFIFRSVVYSMGIFTTAYLALGILLRIRRSLLEKIS
jgi:hypothetical protein